MRPDVSIIIVSFNTREMTLACVQSVIREAGDLHQEIIILDNASSDGSADAIAETFPELRLIRLDKNIGFGPGNNRAAALATADLVLLLNPDTIVLDRAVERLVKFASANAGSRIWGGRTLFANMALNPASCWGFMSLRSLFFQATGASAVFKNNPFFNPEGYGGWRRDTVRPVDIVSGCFLLIEHALWKQLGGFDETFFMYAEEADLCFRARALGATPILTPVATIVHYGGASEPARAGKLVRLLSGKATFIRKNWLGIRAAAGLRLLELSVLVRRAGYALAHRLRPGGRYRDGAAQWRDVWRARRSWISGYPSS
jgi:GT2 family glycosyltransferase